jgi:glucose-6-phosphate 1-epimerase
MLDTIHQLNRQFAIDGVAEFGRGDGGLTQLSITSDAANATLYPHGGHVTHFQTRSGEPLLWVSAASRFAAGQAIRGGVPIVFPWFGARQGDPDAPAHGLVRTAPWAVTAVAQLDDGRVRVALHIDVAQFRVVYQVTVGHQLGLEMTVTNTSRQEASFEQALHTYLAVGDVRQIRVGGLQGATFIDKVDAFQRKTQPREPVTFAGEVDSVYLDTEATVRVEDPLWGRTVVVEKTGSQSTVVWNPWIAKSKKMSDFGDDEWPGMVCIETANVADNTIRLAPGAEATMCARYRTE